MLSVKMQKLAEEAGFIFWGNESYGPGPGHIDWASDYDEEFKKFAELLVLECISKAEDYGLGCDAIEQLKEDFGVE